MVHVVRISNVQDGSEKNDWTGYKIGSTFLFFKYTRSDRVVRSFCRSSEFCIRVAAAIRNERGWCSPRTFVRRFIRVFLRIPCHGARIGPKIKRITVVRRSQKPSGTFTSNPDDDTRIGSRYVINNLVTSRISRRKRVRARSSRT